MMDSPSASAGGENNLLVKKSAKSEKPLKTAGSASSKPSRKVKSSAAKHNSKRQLLVPKLSSSSSDSSDEEATRDENVDGKNAVLDDENDDIEQISRHRLPTFGTTATGASASETSLTNEVDATIDGLTRSGDEDETNVIKDAIKWATDHPLTEAMHIEQALQVMLDDIRGRMGQDVEYESLPLREYFRRGFACSHRATQTDASDIIDLEGLMQVARQLRDDLTDVRRELELQIALIRTDMEHRMKEMFALMFREATKQDKIGEQKRRRELERMRRGMRQQLKNAVEGVKKWYIDYYEELLKKERASRVNNTIGRERFDDLQRIVAARDDELARLRNKNDEQRREIEQLQVAAQASNSNTLTVIPAATRAASPTAALKPSSSARSADSWERVTKAKQQQDADLNQLRSELEKYKNQNKQLLTELETARQELFSKTEENQALQGQIDTNANASASAEEQQARTARLESQLRREKQRQMTELEELQRQAREEQLRAARQAQQERSATASVVQAANTRYSDWLANYVLDIDGRQVPLREATEELRRRFQVEQQLRDEIALLTREAQRLNKIWARKFAILKSSQAALRNEMYLRRLIERKMEPYLDQDNWVCTPREQQVRMVDSFAATVVERDGVKEVRKQKLSATRDAEPFLALGPVPPAVRVNLSQRKLFLPPPQQGSKSTSGKQTTRGEENSQTLSVALVQHEAIQASGDNIRSVVAVTQEQTPSPPRLQRTSSSAALLFLVDCAVQTDNDDDVLLPAEDLYGVNDEEEQEESGSAVDDNDLQN